MMALMGKNPDSMFNISLDHAGFAKRKAEKEDMRILHRTHRSVEFLETLEALYIREIGPTLNTKDEYRSRELSIIF